MVKVINGIRVFSDGKIKHIAPGGDVNCSDIPVTIKSNLVGRGVLEVALTSSAPVEPAPTPESNSNDSTEEEVSAPVENDSKPKGKKTSAKGNTKKKS